jgi:hypothetical protein
VGQTVIPEEKKPQLRKDFTGLSPTKRCLKPSDLPGWALIGISRKILSGKKWREVGAEINKEPSHLYRYFQTPGGKEYAAGIQEQRDAMTDPVQIARLGAMLEAPYWQQEAFVHYLAVKEAGDFAEMGRTIRHQLKVTGVEQPENKQQGPAVIVINNQQQPMSVEYQMGDSTHTKVIDAEIIEDG